MAIIPNIVSAKGAIVDFLTGAISIDSGTAEQNINGDGKLSLSWKSLQGGVINLGDEIDLGELGKFIANDIYVPTLGANGVYTWSPTLVSTDTLLGKTLFWKDVTLSDGTATKLFTFSYVGTAGTIVAELNAAASGVGSVTIASELEELGISVSFDGDTIKSAAQKIASACGKNITIIEGNIEIGVHEAYTVDDYYNYFIVLGGTRNMGKKTLRDSQYYSAVTQRLTIDDNGSVIDRSAGEPKMMKLLVNDNIYPKMELTIGSVDSRTCWMLDEKGEKIPTEWYIIDGKKYPVEETCKKYKKYYITLNLGDAQYSLNTDILIAGKPLGILFQDGVLAGREFDLVSFSEVTHEKEDDDVDPDGYTAQPGQYRIIMQADGDTLLPNDTLAPTAGNKVTLTGVALDSAYVAAARQELAAWGQKMASLYSTKKVPQFEAEEIVQDFLLETVTPVRLGDTYSSRSRQVTLKSVKSSSELTLGENTESDYICTSVTTDLITGAKKVTFGTFKAKGLLQSMIDKIDAVSLSGGAGTVGEDYTRNTAPMGIDQFRALQQAGGSLGMLSVNRKISANAQSIEDLAEVVEDVKEQSDRKFDIWYGQGTPWPQEDDGEDQSDRYIYPAYEWDTVEEKEQHLQDLYYDMTREAQEMGGNVWRWSKKTVEGTVIYYWELITDGDTLAAYEKINDVAADGKLSGGAEKLKVLIEWTNAAEEYAVNYQKYIESGVEQWAAYDRAFRLLCKFLNNGADLFAAESSDENADELVVNIPLPLLIDNDHIQITSGISFTVEDSEGNEKDYYDCWADYYAARSAFSAALIERANQTAAGALAELSKLSDDNLLAVAEKPAVLREWQAAYSEYSTLTAQTGRAHILNGEAYTNYKLAYRKLGTYLESPSTYDPNNLMPTPKDVPAIFDEAPGQQGNEDTAIDGGLFNSLWKDYYAKRGLLMTAIGVSRTSNFVGTEVPDAPYYQGDLWMKIETEDNSVKTLMICVRSREQDAPAYERINDWKEYDVNVDDPRVLLAALADKLYASVPSVRDVLKTRALTLYFTATSSGEDGDIRYDGSTVAVKSGSGWVNLGDPVLADAFGAVAAMIGVSSLTLNGEPEPGSASKYDLRIHQLSFTVNIDGQDVGSYDGSIEVQMYNGERWELITKSINSILENLGNIIKMFVFGSEDGNFKTSAGQFITQNAVQMFAQAKVHDTRDEHGEWKLPGEHDRNGDVLLTEALFGLRVERYTDEEGVERWRSTAKLSADRVDFEGKSINLGAAENINLKASQIQAIGDMELQGRFTTVDAVKLIYSTLAGGSLEIGTYTNNDDNTRNETPRYRVTLIERNGTMQPVLQFLDTDGKTPVMQFDETLLDQIRTSTSETDTGTGNKVITTYSVVDDSYTPVKFRPIANIATATFDTVEATAPVAFYRFSEGFKQTTVIVKDALGNELSRTVTKEYNYGDGGDKSRPDRTKDFRIFVGTTLDSGYMPNGYYALENAYRNPPANGLVTLQYIVQRATEGSLATYGYISKQIQATE